MPRATNFAKFNPRSHPVLLLFCQSLDNLFIYRAVHVRAAARRPPSAPGRKNFREFYSFLVDSLYVLNKMLGARGEPTYSPRED